jgi:DNA-binding MltR family transcriptional regulator
MKNESIANSVERDNINQDLYAELNGGSERAAAIFGAAILDELLRQVLVAFMISDYKETKELTCDAGALGTFSSRIRAAYCLGLLTAEERNDLHLIRRIRNPFAHRVRAPSFEEGQIRDLSLNLSFGKRFLNQDQRNSPRDCFQTTTSALAYSLSVRALQVRREQRLPRGEQ